MKTEKQTPENSSAVAIIGMGCFFPGASGLKNYWRLLSRGQDAITEVPETHWSPADYYDADPKKPDHVYCTRGGFLRPVPFDPSEFGIPPTSLEATDTSQLLGLLAAKLALEDAGYGEDRDFARSRTGVILGVTGTQELVIPLGARLGHPHWRRALKAAGISDEKSGEVIRRISDAYVPWQESSFPGLLGNVIAGRISNRLNLQGTNCAVDAACASSMSAMHMALMEIHSGRADMMLTGGVDCLNDIFMHMCFSKTPILSPTGDVRPFSDRADGTLLGEGVGLLIFKRLDLAEADGDRIYAVIKAVGSSSDGKSNSIYAPLAEGQMKALRMAYENAGFAPESVELLEAHGTGTRVGDEVEFRALRQIYTDPSLNLSGNGHQNYCAVGTVKSMIGHTKAAAGAAGLVKNALALYHKVLPPTLKIQTPDPRLNIHDSPFYLNTEKRPWLSGRKHPRRCAVSSFGFGGSNFHMVLEEYQQKKTGPSWDGSVEILALSANSPEELETGLSAWKKEIDQGMTDEELAEKAAQTRLAFSHRTPFRLLMVLEKALDRFENLTEHFSEALESLKTHLKTGAREKAVNIRNIFYGGPESPAKLAFVFPGQGSQYTRMGRDLICCFPEALETLEKADENVKLSRKLSDFIYPLPVFDSREKEKQESALRSTDAAQPGIGALSLAMVKILQRFGIRPDAACGHSFGEISALCAGGKMDEDSFFRLAAERGRLMAEAGKSNAGTMTAVKAPLAEIEKIIREECPDVILANRNSPDQGVLSASLPAIEKAEKVFHEKGFSTVRLPVSAAFHSSLMAEAGKSFAETVSGISIKSSDIPVFSNADGRPYPEEPEAARKVLGEQLLSPVDFVSEIRNLFESGVRTFVEVGPKSVLSGLIRNILKGFYFQALSLDASAGKRFGIADLAKLLCHLAALGHPVDLKNWENPVPPRRKQRMSIPISGANYRRKSETPAVKTPEKKPKNEQPDIYPNTQPPSPANPSPDLHSAVLRTGGGTFSGRKNADTASQTAFTAASKDTQTAATADTRTGKQQARPEKKETVPAEPPGQRETVPYKTERNMQNMNRQQNKPTARQPGQNEYIAEAFRAVQEGLRSMQNLHFHTAETHKKFLESQNHAGRTLQQMMDNTRRLAEISIGINGAEGGMKSGVHSGMQQMHYREENRKIPVPEEGNAENESAADSPLHSGQMPHSVQSGETSPPRRAESPSLSPASPKMRHRQENRGISVSAGTSGAVQSPPQTSACPEPVKKPAPAPKKNGRQKVEKTMLDVVSDLTGYPADMLSLDMDIEADLGIDSIKRVEILSRFEEKMPELPPVSPEIMGTLKTLGQIVEYLMGAGIRPGQTGDISPNEPAVKDTSSDTRETVHPPTAADGGKPAADLQKIESVMLEVVSELTGYPPDMLSLDMDIEADLGIDSIKRVEILSSFEEKMPELPPVSP
ncbi:MAG: beta-ketoacyl synthase N-terminal-like domain-containing protein, partial [Desulfococcaceae bacterium]|nr:beta-ketoacyl synthase N-terminal-like domain-containing protein [Desulfococcaceae bacterium]